MNFMASRQGFYEDDTRGGSLRPFSSHSSSSSSTTTASASASASSSQQKVGLTSVPMSSYHHHHHLNLHHQTRRGWDESPTTTSNTTNFRCSRQQGGVSHLDLMMDSSSNSSPTNNIINNGDDADDSDDHLLTRQGGLIIDSTEAQGLGSGSGSGSGSAMIEREHMFDKVVTPSDVGKLNRLVIPKQHAEKYFPLDSSTNEKGLLLNFEDRNGKPWRFRYSYWNSSQSYVMTKGWSRFVKEKKLDAGDIVSFQRGVGELGKDRLFIDWRRRPDAPDHHLHHFHRHHQNLHPSVSPYTSLPHHHFSFHPWSHPYYLQQQQHQQQAQPTLPVPLSRDMTCQNFLQVNAINNHHLNNTYGTYGSTSSVMNGNPCPSSLLYLRSSAHGSHHHVPPTSQQVGIGIVQLQRTGGGMEVEEPMVYESVPVVQGKAAAKRFRLFGVNMECPLSGSDDILSSTAVPNSSMAPQQHSHFSSSPSPSSSSSSNINTSCQLRPYSGTPVLQTMSSDILKNNNKGKTSMSLDFDV